MAFKTKRLVFEDNLLSDVIETLNKVYRSDIKLKTRNLSKYKLTATFDNQSLEAILNVIKATLDLTLQKNGSVFELSGKTLK